MTALHNSTALPARSPAAMADPNALARLPGVSDMTGLSRSSIYDLIQRELFPAPVKVGPKLAVWPKTDVSAWCAAQIAGKSPDEIKALVAALMEARKNRI